MTIQESVSNSNYNGMWLSAEKRLAKGLTFNVSYTFSKSIDNNSVGSSNPQIQNFYNIASGAGALRFRRAAALRAERHLPAAVQVGPQRLHQPSGRRAGASAPIVNLQTGNPFSPIIPIADPSSLETFDRPNLVAGQPLTLANPTPSQWLNKAAFVLAPTGHLRQCRPEHPDGAGIRGYRLRDLEDHGRSRSASRCNSAPRRSISSTTRTSRSRRTTSPRPTTARSWPRAPPAATWAVRASSSWA